MSNKKNALITHLSNCRTDSVFHTHVSLINPKGKFSFNKDGLEKFWDLYCKLMSNKVNKIPIIGIAEKSQNYLPVLADIDIKVREDEKVVKGVDENGLLTETTISNTKGIKDSLYSLAQLRKVVEIYQSVLRKIVDNCTDTKLLCIVLEKKMYSIQKNGITYLKHGFHLHFPNCFLSKADQEVHLIPRIKDHLQELELFKNLGIEDSGETIDKYCCKVPWLLYGSRKTETSEPYLVTKVYNSEMKKVKLESALKNYQIFDDKEDPIDIIGKFEYYLPRILSIMPYNREISTLVSNLMMPIKEKLRKEEENCEDGGKQSYKKLSNQQSVEIAKKLLPLLADFRTEDYNEWMTIGWALYNISDGSQDGLDLWCDFSSRCVEKYDETYCVHQWQRMIKKDISLGTIRHYAKLDSPVEYANFKREESEKYIKEAIAGSHNDIAKALYAEYGDEFICASVANKVWYQFINNKWEQVEEGVELRKKISDEIVKRFVKIGQDLYAQMAGAQDQEEKILSIKQKAVTKIVHNLKSATYKAGVMKEACDIFYDKHFKDRLDTNPYLIAFNNGVYDLKTNVFRPGRPEDYLSKNMPVDYIAYSEDDEKVLEVYSFLEKIFPDKSVRQYFMDIASSVFVGGNQQKIVVFWTGEGDNGKSVTQGFFEKMFGKLAIKFNTNVITGKKPSSGSANADLARAGGGIRWAVFEEPDSDEMINVGILKHLSGNDSFYARDLFEKGKDGREITPMFKLTFITNKLPKLKFADKATWNRIRVIPFEATFCRSDNPAPETYEEQLLQKRFPMDPTFHLKIPSLISAFAWVLLQHKTQIQNKPIIEPEKVKIATTLYQKQNDMYRQFMEEHITSDKTKVLTLTEVYAQFKEWFKESIPNTSIIPKSDLEDYLTKVWGEPMRGKKWKGYRIKTIHENDMEEDEVVEEDTNEEDEEKNEDEEYNEDKNEEEENKVLKSPKKVKKNLKKVKKSTSSAKGSLKSDKKSEEEIVFEIEDENSVNEDE